MVSISKLINNLKININKKENQSAEESVDFFYEDIEVFDKFGYGRNGDFDVNIYSYYMNHANADVIDVTYTEIF